MIDEPLPLAKQLDLVFTEITPELSYLKSGIVFVQIRNNTIGKFGIKHHPIDSKNGNVERVERGLSSQHIQAFRKMAIHSLKHKVGWTHGEILFEFALKNDNTLISSVQFESNYNMSNLISNSKKKIQK